MIIWRKGGRCSLIALLLCLISTWSFAVDTLGDGPDGATCHAFNRGVGGDWERKGGDWQDASHQKFGSRPYSTVTVPEAYKGRTVQLDVTALVKDWMLGKADASKGMMIIPLSGNGILVVSSREHATIADRPVLMFEFSDGRADIVFPNADSYLDCSTYSSLGQEDRLKLGGGALGILGFPLPASLRERRVVKAMLTLSLQKQYGGGVTLGAFAVSPPSSPDTLPRPGLATRYANEDALAKDPDVYFVSGFESVAWEAGWSYYDPRSYAERVSEDPERGFVPLSGDALRVRFKKGKNLGLDLRYGFRNKLGFEPEEVYFRYYLRLGSSWSPDTDGGKLPGFGGTYGKAGWGLRQSSGYDGWSLRGLFSVMASASNPMAGSTPIGTYAYHADMASESGDNLNWSLGRLAALQRNRWYCIEQYLKLNKPGQKNGILRAWVDGRLAYEKTDLRLRKTSELKIETIWFNIYHGGTAPPPRDMDVYIDNVVIAKSYIGPMRSAVTR